MEYNRIMKKIGYVMIVIGAVIISYMLGFALQPENIGVIGWADGPTEIVISD